MNIDTQFIMSLKYSIRISRGNYYINVY